MNLAIARVLSCNENGCQVQPIDSGPTLTTRYSKPVIKYNIPIRPQQFVIVDKETIPPETIFRFSRATVTNVDGTQVELDDNGQLLVATQATVVQETLQPGDDVLLKGYREVGWRIIDTVVDNRPAHPEQIVAEWFPLMKDAATRATE